MAIVLKREDPISDFVLAHYQITKITRRYSSLTLAFTKSPHILMQSEARYLPRSHIIACGPSAECNGDLKCLDKVLY